MSIFTGSGVAIITPMKEDGAVHFDKLGEIIEFQIKSGTDAIIICGTTGEASTLTHEEHLECIDYAVKKTAKRIPVIAGTGSNCTQTAIYLSKEAEKRSADALLVVSPYYNKATQKGLIAHFGAIADSVKIPIVLYNVPSRTGCNILPETVLALASQYSNIVAMKEASGNLAQVGKLASLTSGKIDIYSGNDDVIVPLLSLGGKGVISVLANIAPRYTHDMVDAYLSGNTAKSTEMQLNVMELCDALFCEVNPIPVKAAMNYMGFETGSVRQPLTEIEDAHGEQLRNAMVKFGIKLA